MARSTRLVILIQHKLPSTCYILSDESSKPFYSTSNGYRKLRIKRIFVKKSKSYISAIKLGIFITIERNRFRIRNSLLKTASFKI